MMQAKEWMTRHVDRDYLVKAEYDAASKLNTRIEIQEHFSNNSCGWFQWLYNHLDLPLSCRILELGSGPGTLWLENIHHLPGEWAITLSDLSPGMVEQVQQKLKRPQFTFAVINVEAIPFTARQFDAVIANGLFDHLPHQDRALAEISRVLKPGGRLYASTGGRTHLQELEALVRPFVPDADYGGASERFGLENGATLLSSRFTGIQCYHYQDELIFCEAGPVVAYVLSEADVKSKLVGEPRAEFIRFVERRLLAQKNLRVTVDKGIFAARKTF